MCTDDSALRHLLDKVRLIERQNTTTRDAVSAEVDAFSGAKILTTGKSYEDLKFSTAISLLLSKSSTIPEPS